jgi:hypothetical protein
MEQESSSKLLRQDAGSATVHPDDGALGHQGCKCHFIPLRRHPFPSLVVTIAAPPVTLF